MTNRINKILSKYFNNENLHKGNFKNYNLETISTLLKYSGNPQKKINFIHIAGTNGKGSTAFIIANILKNSGIKSGLFTSPHLEKMNERIKLNLKNIPNNKLLENIVFFENIITGHSLKPTFFDLITAIAIKYFFDNKVDIAIMETGLGGRLDTTNIIKPLMSIITDISMDHKSILGKTLERITEEKAGIIKEKTPVITSNTNNKIVKIIKKFSTEKNSPFYIYNSNFFIKNIKDNNPGFTFDFYFKNTELLKLKTNIEQNFQLKNIALSLTAIEILKNNKFLIDEKNIRKTINFITIPGRFEKLSSKPLVYFDPAHNMQSIDSIMKFLEKSKKPKYKLTVFLTFMKDKEPEKIIKKYLSCSFIEFHYINIEDKRAFRLKEDIGITTHDINTPQSILSTIKKNKNNLFLFTGTFRLYNIAKKIVNSLKNK